MHYKVYNGNEEEKRFKTFNEARSYVWNTLLQQNFLYWNSYFSLEDIRLGTCYGNNCVTFDLFEDD